MSPRARDRSRRHAVAPRFPFALVLHCTQREVEALAVGVVPAAVRNAMQLCAAECLVPNAGAKTIAIHRARVPGPRRARPT